MYVKKFCIRRHRIIIIVPSILCSILKYTHILVQPYLAAHLSTPAREMSPARHAHTKHECLLHWAIGKDEGKRWCR